MRKPEDASGPSDTICWPMYRLNTTSYISDYDGHENIDVDIYR